MKLNFTKMHGLGNDMIVLDSLKSGFTPSADQARYLCDRRQGVGADQILVLLPSGQADFKMLIFNSDGSEVEMCGNGMRCLARFIRERGISSKNPLAIETLAGIIRPEVIGDMVKVDMGEPIFEADQIPAQGKGRLRNVAIMADDRAVKLSALSMGNPHAVIQVEDVEIAPLEELGPKIEHHPMFPKRTNVGFVQVEGRSHLLVRVWERGAGATLACGTGACAAAVATMDLGLSDREVKVTLPGGDLVIKWDPATNHVWMTGPATFVFDGELELPNSIRR